MHYYHNITEYVARQATTTAAAAVAAAAWLSTAVESEYLRKQQRLANLL